MNKKRNNIPSKYYELDLEGYAMSERHRARLARAVKNSMPILAYVLSCPAYDSVSEGDAFQVLSGGVPTMTNQHLNGLNPLLDLLVGDGADIQVVTMLADIEAHNEHLVDKYAKGDSDIYQRFCDDSVSKIASVYTEEYSTRNVCFRSSSFLREFEDDKKLNSCSKFLSLRNDYKKILLLRYALDRKFYHKVLNVVRESIKDSDYIREYSNAAQGVTGEHVEREITTMSEYLALGRLIGDTSCQPLVVVHASSNTYLLNEGVTYDTEGKPTNQASIPLLIRDRKAA